MLSRGINAFIYKDLKIPLFNVWSSTSQVEMMCCVLFMTKHSLGNRKMALHHTGLPLEALHRANHMNDIPQTTPHLSPKPSRPPNTKQQ